MTIKYIIGVIAYIATAVTIAMVIGVVYVFNDFIDSIIGGM